MSVTYYGPGIAKERFQHFLDNPPAAIAIDVETISLIERIPLGFAVAFSPEEAIYFQVHPELPAELELIKRLMVNPAVRKIAHNLPFDFSILPGIPHLEGLDRCLHPDTKVLRSNLVWVNISSIKVGDELIGIDEHHQPDKRVRKLRNTTVTQTGRVVLPASIIVLANGRYVIASNEHPWLAVKGDVTDNTNRWTETRFIRPGDYIRHGFDVWDVDDSYEAGYIAGLLDGDGSLIPSHNNSVIFGQIVGDTSDLYTKLLDTKKINYTIQQYEKTNTRKPFMSVCVQNQKDVTRLLGSVRPARLLKKFSLEGFEPADRDSLVEVISVIAMPEPVELVSIQTSCSTFVAEGLFTHNSNLWDTNIAARLLSKEFTDLPYLSEVDLGMEVTSAKSMLKPGGTMLDVPTKVLADKCQRDARACYALYLKYLPLINAYHKQGFSIDMEVIPILIDMSQRGLLIDQEARDTLSVKYAAEIEFYRDQVQSFGVDNPGSPKQVGLVLAERGNFLPFTKTKKQLSTDSNILEFLSDPMAAAVLGFRRVSKFKSTYLDPLEGMDRFYTEYYMDTVVGRMNSRNRNIQNIPPDARHMILPSNRYFTTMDYGKEHMYILAHMSQDRDMLRVLYDPDPIKSNIHQHTADIMRISYKLAKVVNYAVAYGATAKTIQENGKIRDRRLCDRLLEDWFRTYPGAADWIIYAQREGLRDGFALPTLFGRRIRIPPTEREDAQRRKAVNYPILGSDGEVIKRAILLCAQKGLGPPIMAITVHDSITFDGDVELPQEELESIPGFRIPIDIKKTLYWE